MKLYINDILKYNVHIGHSASSSLMLSSWFFFKLRKRIWIINIFKTIIFLKFILKFLTFLVNNEYPFWFINFEYSKAHIFKKSADTCGEYSCTKKWIRGFLSNFKSIQKAIKNYSIKRVMYNNCMIKTHLIRSWVFTRYTWPRGIFLSNIPLNYIICKEATDILLPVVAMVDTNIKSYLFSYPIPSNDDSLESVSYIMNLLSTHILLSKYKKVVLWFSKYKKNKFIYLNIFKNLVKESKLKKKERYKKFFLKIIRNNNFSNMLSIKLFHNVKPLWRNVIRVFKSKLITFKNVKKNKNLSVISRNVLRKLKFINKINYRNIFFQKFLKKRANRQFTNGLQILNQLKNTAVLSRLRKKRKWSYFNYLYLINLIKQARFFHESFIVNKPSDFIFLQFFQKYDTRLKKPEWANEKDFIIDNNDFKDLVIKRNSKWKIKWLNNSFNQRLLQNPKLEKTSYFSDSALILNIERWLPKSQHSYLIKKVRRTILHLWLIPFMKHYSVRDGYNWFMPQFYCKEDNGYRRSLSWNLSKYKITAPISTLNYYSNWFFNMLKFINKNTIRFNKKKIRLKKFYV